MHNLKAFSSAGMLLRGAYDPTQNNQNAGLHHLHTAITTTNRSID